MNSARDLKEVARLPTPRDNCAVAIHRIEAGTRIRFHGRQFDLKGAVPEGHRFTVRAVANGDPLTSWGLPFGRALLKLCAGTPLCNQAVLGELRLRGLDRQLEVEANFQDLEPRAYVLDEGLQPASQVPLHGTSRTFAGYYRGTSRGAGTRNHILILGTTSRTASFARLLARRMSARQPVLKNVDAIVAVAHTEGGSHEGPNNRELLLRTLAGFIVHPNIGAVLAVDYGSEPVTNRLLKRFMEAEGYPLHDVPHHFLSLKSSFETEFGRARRILGKWVDRLKTESHRSDVGLAHLRVALQCGGSDAFSGISGNPLVAWVAREIIRYGGSVNLAETDELIGAESYLLQKVRSFETAHRFLQMVERFKQRVAWHGHDAEGNPSGGNRLRGLYNISLKSIGAAMKRHPDVRLDQVIQYAQRMGGPGFLFMDSPGNDLESVAGQVASGVNQIFFTTGNGSVTNFPFVPTLKIITTTRRYRLLTHEMDVNGGDYLDGTRLEELGRRTLELAVRVASGESTKGERAGHYQVSIWRDWRQTRASRLRSRQEESFLSGRPIPVGGLRPSHPLTFEAMRRGKTYTTEETGLILPTSLCSGQVARLAAARMNSRRWAPKGWLSRFVTLVHTEGCGVSGGSSQDLYNRTLIGYLLHPLVKHALLLEHGCEKTHNSYMRAQLRSQGLDVNRFGFASVQLDGGIDCALLRIQRWFRGAMEGAEPVIRKTVGFHHLRLGLLTTGPIPSSLANMLAGLTRTLVACGSTVVIPSSAGLLHSHALLDQVVGKRETAPDLAYGQRVREPGFHLMETPTRHTVETISGLGATGVHLIVAAIGEHPLPAHPLIPLLQVTAAEPVADRYGSDLDLTFDGPAAGWLDRILGLIARTASGDYIPNYLRLRNTDFQITRGRLGVSM
ncbi:MAG: UxaA family hydrolase [Acidobacteriota bacterium]